jgi:hypothetical protein
MFTLFGRSKTQAVTTPEAAPLDYTLTEKQQAAFDSLTADADGFVRIGDVTHGLLNQQSQYITRYMDGSNPSVPVLVDGLRVNVDSSSHHEYTIHRNDALEFIARVKAHRSMR